MNDTISRREAIEALCQARCGSGHCGVSCDVVKAIEQLPSAQQWIPVSERLPKEDTDVLISYRYKEGEGDTSHAYIDITSYGDMYFGGRKVKGAKHWRQPFEYFTSNYEVIAWMPLPEPWKEENSVQKNSDIDEAVKYIKSTQEYLTNIGETWYADYLSDAIDLLVGERRGEEDENNN